MTIAHEVKKAINKIVREKGRFPNLLEMCEVLSFSAEQVYKCMDALTEDGYLETVGSWYKFTGDLKQKAQEILHPKESTGKDEIEKRLHIEIAGKEISPEDYAIVTSEEEEKFDEFLKTEPFKFLEYPKREIDIPPKIYGDKAGQVGIENKKEIEVEFKADVSKTVESIKKLEKKIRPKNKKEIKEDFSLYGVPIYIIQLCMGIIGIGAVIISVYYTTIWLIEFLPWALAVLLSSIMVGFSVMAFETVILFISGQVTKSRTLKVIIASGFIVLWIIVSAFSVGSTIAGQYNKNAHNVKEQIKRGAGANQASWNILKERKTDLQKRLEENRQQITTLNNILSGMGDINTRADNTQLWNETQWRLQVANNNMLKVEIELSKARDEEKIQIEESKKNGIILSSDSSTEIPDFYSWIGKIFSIAKDKVQFWLSVFPAVFCDVVAPSALAICLFLRQKYIKNER